MIWNKKFNYPTSTRALINGKRHYDVGTHEKLPSVTTILQATQSEEKRKKLEEWRKRMGAQYADRVKDIAALRGTSMHTYLEGYIKGERHLDLTRWQGSRDHGTKGYRIRTRGPGRGMGY